MFTLKIGGKLDRFMKECDAWKQASADEKVNGCLFLRSFLIASLKYLIGIAIIAIMIVAFWAFFRFAGEAVVALWLHFVQGMEKEQIDSFVEKHVIWFWFVPHILAAVWSVIYQAIRKWRDNTRSARIRQKELQEDLRKSLPPPPPRQPNKVILILKALAGRACFKINVVK